MNVLESTLQTALLPRAVFDVWQEAAKMFDQGKLAGQSVRKRSSGKKPELTQNQVGLLSVNLYPKLHIFSHSTVQTMSFKETLTATCHACSIHCRLRYVKLSTNKDYK